MTLKLVINSNPMKEVIVDSIVDCRQEGINASICVTKRFLQINSAFPLTDGKILYTPLSFTVATVPQVKRIMREVQQRNGREERRRGIRVDIFSRKHAFLDNRRQKKKSDNGIVPKRIDKRARHSTTLFPKWPR